MAIRDVQIYLKERNFQIPSFKKIDLVLFLSK